MGALRIPGEEHCRDSSGDKEAGAPVASGSNADVVVLSYIPLGLFKKEGQRIFGGGMVNLI